MAACGDSCGSACQEKIRQEEAHKWAEKQLAKEKAAKAAADKARERAHQSRVDKKLAEYEKQIKSLRDQMHNGNSASTGGSYGAYSWNSNTSSEFAGNVYNAFVANGRTSGWVTAWSPAMSKDYELYCQVGAPTICSGGNTNDAAVYIN